MLPKKIVVSILIGVLVVLSTAGLAEAGTAYTVRAGDSLYLISTRFGTTVPDLKSANGLTGNSLYVGQRLVIPGGTGGSGGASASKVAGTRYIVQGGDNLYKISVKFGVTVDSIRKANKLWKDLLYPGQALTIPGRNSREVTTASRSFSRSEMDLLAKAVFAEARGESYEGQVAVAAVILNRVKHPDFPNTISGVIYQPGAFTAVDDGQINLAPNQSAYNAVRDAINGWDPSKGAIYYWNPATAQSKWVWSRPVTVQIGNHIFAK